MQTRSKLAIARSLRNILKCCGLQRMQKATRGGITWNLDLDEGIDLSIYLFGGFEKKTREALMWLLKKTPGDAVDIGANIGSQCLPMAKYCEGRVHAFEPTKFAYDRLKENMKLNPGLETRIVANHTLLWDGKSDEPTAIESSWPLNGTEGHKLHGGVRKATAGAQAEKLDDYLERREVSQVAVIKLDVDGNEPIVLGGAANTLKRKIPIVMEWAPYTAEEKGNGWEETREALREAGYKAHTLDGKEIGWDTLTTAQKGESREILLK